MLVLLSASCVFGHTWIGCAQMVNGVCQGYIRNYLGRNTPTSNVDDYYTWKALGRPQDFALCKPEQSQRTYSATYPMPIAKAGDTVNVMYTPNGHSQPGDHGLTTTARIHWTGNANTVLSTRADLSDSNRLAQWNYGSNCATTGDVASEPCVNGFTIPAGTPTGVYQFVWYWPYDKDQQQVPIGEEYFSCFDVSVTGTNAVQPPAQTSTQAANPQTTTTQAANPQTTTTQAANPQTTTTHAANPQTTTTQANPQTSQAGQPTSTSNSNLCATSLADCKTFCAPALATVCNCDPTTGAKNVQCASGDSTSDASSTYLVALSSTVTLVALLQML